VSGDLVWLHEDALRRSHPCALVAGEGATRIHIWDDTYLQDANYSLKRLVFLYETAAEAGIDMIRGDTYLTLLRHPAAHVWVPQSANPFIRTVVERLCAYKRVTVVEDDTFVRLPGGLSHQRFFAYWRQAEKTACLRDGGSPA
jgi:hypothetical protein